LGRQGEGGRWPRSGKRVKEKEEKRKGKEKGKEKEFSFAIESDKFTETR
jgi:hypothetical protein